MKKLFIILAILPFLILWPWLTFWIIINTIAILSNLRYLQTERERYRRLVKTYEQLNHTLDALEAVFEDSARRIEDRERVMKQQLAARAEQLIVMKTARGKNGSFEIARLFVTETDLAFLKGRPGLWGSFAEAVKDVGERWFYQAISNPI